MLELLRFLIFGKRCLHEWKLEQSMEAYTNCYKYLYICQKCGKMKKTTLYIRDNYDF